MYEFLEYYLHAERRVETGGRKGTLVADENRRGCVEKFGTEFPDLLKEIVESYKETGWRVSLILIIDGDAEVISNV